MSTRLDRLEERWKKENKITKGNVRWLITQVHLFEALKQARQEAEDEGEDS